MGGPPLPRIAVRLRASGHGEVSANGQPLDGVVAVNLEAAVDRVPRVTVTLIGDIDIEAEGMVDVTTIADTSRRWKKAEP